MQTIAKLIVSLLKEAKAPPGQNSRSKAEVSPARLAAVQQEVRDLLKQFPLYPELIID